MSAFRPRPARSPSASTAPGVLPPLLSVSCRRTVSTQPPCCPLPSCRISCLLSVQSPVTVLLCTQGSCRKFVESRTQRNAYSGAQNTKSMHSFASEAFPRDPPKTLLHARLSAALPRCWAHMTCGQPSLPGCHSSAAVQTCTPLFPAALLTAARLQSAQVCTPGDQIERTSHTCTMEW